MGVWVEQVVPRIANRALDTEAVREVRARVCAGLAGEVLEVGFGSGLNVPHYPHAVVRAVRDPRDDLLQPHAHGDHLRAVRPRRAPAARACR